MYKIFLDTNVALDLIANREPFVQDAIPLLSLIDKGNAHLFISEVSVGTLIYLAFDRYKLPDAKGKLEQFIEFCGVICGGKEAFLRSMSSDFRDKEDGIQYFTAQMHQMDFFLTRNKPDFIFGGNKIQILTPKEFFES